MVKRKYLFESLSRSAKYQLLSQEISNSENDSGESSSSESDNDTAIGETGTENEISSGEETETIFESMQAFKRFPLRFFFIN